jgi:hypothetical protein
MWNRGKWLGKRPRNFWNSILKGTDAEEIFRELFFKDGGRSGSQTAPALTYDSCGGNTGKSECSGLASNPKLEPCNRRLSFRVPLS